MENKPILYLYIKITAVAASYLIADTNKADMSVRIISALSFVCIFLLELLISRMNRLHIRHNIILFTASVCLAVCFYLDPKMLMPLIIALVFQLADILTDRAVFYQVFFSASLLLILVAMPEKNIIAAALCIGAMALIARALVNRLEHYMKLNEENKNMVRRMDEKLKDMGELIKTLRTTVSLEERNRIAARIHDEVGHGISGSIILLEAAMLVIKEDSKKAGDSIVKAIKNLRECVDDIRAALREERTDRYRLGINDLAAILEEFKVSYNKSARLKTSGDLVNVGPDIWICIHDNLKECLTNLLKHSNATEFILNIEVFNKVIKVEYKDNGKSSEPFVKNTGLEAIEERTVNAKGRCFFNKNEDGFCVTNIFTY